MLRVPTSYPACVASSALWLETIDCFWALTRDTSDITVICRDLACVTVLRVRLIRDSLAALNCSAARRRLALIAPPVDKGRSKRICQVSLVCSESGGKLNWLSGF